MRPPKPLPPATTTSARDHAHTGDGTRRAHHELWIRIEAFLQMRSPNTRITYRGVVSEWCQFLGAKAGSASGAVRMLAVTELHSMSYRKWLEGRPGQRPRDAERREQGYSGKRAHRGGQIERQGVRHHTKKSGLEATQTNATIAKKFAILRRIYRMLIGAGLGKLNPFDSDRVPPPPKESGRKRPTEMVDFSLVKKIVNTPDKKSSKGLRDRAILAVLFGGGLRRSEAAGLRLGDVRQTNKGTTFLHLRATKAKRDFEQALPDWAARAVRDLIEHRVLKDHAQVGDYLFVGYSGQGGRTPTERPVSTTAIYRLFQHYCAINDAGPYCSPHSARATAITRLLDTGIPHREVQEFSRHSSIQMVELYDKRRINVDQSAAKKLDFD